MEEGLLGWRKHAPRDRAVVPQQIAGLLGFRRTAVVILTASLSDSNLDAHGFATLVPKPQRSVQACPNPPPE